MFRILTTAILFQAGIFHLPAHADEFSCGNYYANKTVRFIIPYAAGGGYDAYARVFAPHFEQRTGARVRLENLPGAKGLTGFRAIRDAQPDGLTLGITNGAKRGMQRYLGDSDLPDILDDFTILSRIARNRTVLVVGADSGITDFEQLFERDPPPVYGANNLRTGSFLSMVLTADLLDMEFDVVNGLGGTRKRILATARGDVDMTASNYFSVISDIESGTVRPIMQMTGSPIADQPLLAGVPLLGGPDGVAARRAARLGKSVEEAVHYARLIEAMVGLGRLIVAPAGLEKNLTDCLQQMVLNTLTLEDFATDIEKTGLALDIADGPGAKSELEFGLSGLDDLVPVLLKRLDSE